MLERVSMRGRAMLDPVFPLHHLGTADQPPTPIHPCSPLVRGRGPASPHHWLILFLHAVCRHTNCGTHDTHTQNLPVLDETGNVDPMGAIIMLSFRLIVEWILLQVQTLVMARKDRLLD
jgi:hypothetical protein